MSFTAKDSTLKIAFRQMNQYLLMNLCLQGGKRVDACTSYFLEMADWMNLPMDGETQAGKITCPTPKCGAKLGAFAHYGA